MFERATGSGSIAPEAFADFTPDNGTNHAEARIEPVVVQTVHAGGFEIEFAAGGDGAAYLTRIR